MVPGDSTTIFKVFQRRQKMVDQPNWVVDGVSAQLNWLVEKFYQK